MPDFLIMANLEFSSFFTKVHQGLSGELTCSFKLLKFLPGEKGAMEWVL